MFTEGQRLALVVASTHFTNGTLQQLIAPGRDRTISKIVGTNVKGVCRCVCGYPVTADLTALLVKE